MVEAQRSFPPSTTFPLLHLLEKRKILIIESRLEFIAIPHYLATHFLVFCDIATKLV
jgi:hypothetical protein